MSPVSSDGLLRHYTMRTPAGEFEVDRRPADGLARQGAQRAPTRWTRPTRRSVRRAAAKAGLGPVIFAGKPDRPSGRHDPEHGGGNRPVLRRHRLRPQQHGQVARRCGREPQRRGQAEAAARDAGSASIPIRTSSRSPTGSTSSPAQPRSAISRSRAPSWRCRARPASSCRTPRPPSTLGDMVSDYSSAQLMDINRDKLARLGVDGATAEQPVRQPLLHAGRRDRDGRGAVDDSAPSGSRRDGRARPPPPTAARPPFSSAAGSS